MKIKLRLEELCEQKEISIYSLADRVGVHYQTPYKWVNGEAFPEKKYLEKLCEIFELESVKDLFE